jgi:hypothetical protein
MRFAVDRGNGDNLTQSSAPGPGAPDWRPGRCSFFGSSGISVHREQEQTQSPSAPGAPKNAEFLGRDSCEAEQPDQARSATENDGDFGGRIARRLDRSSRYPRNFVVM